MSMSMIIEFKGPASLASDGGINYPAKLNGHDLLCHFSYEALEDVDPDTVLGDALTHFATHQLKLLSIAEKKILANQSHAGMIQIHSNDLLLD